MKRLVGTLVVAGLIGGAVWIGLRSGKPLPGPGIAGGPGCGLGLCEDEAVVDVEVLVAACESGPCDTRRMGRRSEPYLAFIDLDAAPGEGCGPGDCGAVPHALLSGWEPGGWRIVAPPLPGLVQPPPQDVELYAGETTHVELVYRPLPAPSAASFGTGRIPTGDLKPCPRGELSAEPPTKQKIRELVAEIVDAANSRRPDPTQLWDLMDRTMRTVYGSFDTFQKKMEKTRLDPVYVEAGVSDQVVAQRSLSSEDALIDVGALCGEAVKDATWMGSAFFPDFEGVSGGAVQLFFVIRPSGPKLWFAY